MIDPRDSMIPPDGCFKPFLIGLIVFAVLCFSLSWALAEKFEASTGVTNPALASGARVIGSPSGSPATVLIQATPTPVQPQDPNCGPAAGVVARLKQTFHELPIFQGAANSGQSIVITHSDKGTWTVLACDLQKCCVRASGTSSHFLAGA